MRSFVHDMVLWLSIIFLCIAYVACAPSSQQTNKGIVESNKQDVYPSPSDSDTDITAKSPAPLYPLAVEPQCAFQEEAPQQNIAYYGMHQNRSLMLQGINSEGLSREQAVQFALANNPDLFAYYENLEIGYAGLIEAGLRQNPVVSASTRFPDDPELKINRTYDTAISFLDYFLIPLREQAALADLHVIEAEIADKVLGLVEDVENNWFEASIMELKFAQESDLVELKQLAAQLAELQLKAGNISALNARERAIEFEFALEKLKNTAAEIEAAREKLSRSLGLFGSETCFNLNKRIDWQSDPLLPDITVLERAAIENRPDLEALRREINSIAQEAKLKEWWTYSNLKVGVSAEQEPEGYTVAGPSIELEVPVFNYGQGERVKFDAKLAQAQKKLLGQALTASSEVREFVKTASIYRSKVEAFENSVLPDFAKQIEAGMTHYNVMTLGAFALFKLKEGEIEARIEQLDALLHYKKALTELLHATGGSFVPVRRSR